MDANCIVLLIVVSCWVPSQARPGYHVAYNTGPGGNFGRDGASQVHLFPSGYAYQTLLADGSLTRVFYVQGLEAQQFLQHSVEAGQVLRANPQLQTTATGVIEHVEIPAIPSSSGTSGEAPSALEARSNEGAAPSVDVSSPAPTEVIPNQNFDSANAVPPAQSPPNRSFFGLTVPSFQMSPFFTTPFNTFMSLFGIPPIGTGREANSGTEPQASSVASIVAPLSPRIASDPEPQPPQAAPEVITIPNGSSDPSNNDVASETTTVAPAATVSEVVTSTTAPPSEPEVIVVAGGESTGVTPAPSTSAPEADSTSGSPTTLEESSSPSSVNTEQTAFESAASTETPAVNVGVQTTENSTEETSTQAA